MSSAGEDRSDGASQRSTPLDDSEIAFGDPAAEGGQEKALEQQLSRLKRKLRSAKAHCDNLRKANDELQEESARIRVESHEYMSYIDKKVKKRETMVVTLNAKNMKDLKDITMRKEEMTEHFLKLEQDAHNDILRKEVEFASVRRELDELDHLREARSAQEMQIARLQAEVADLEMSHTERRQSLKLSFVQARKRFEDDAKAAIAKLSKEANADAVKQVLERTEQVKRSNVDLRDKVKYIVEECRVLDNRRVGMMKRVSDLEAEIAAQKQLNLYRFGSPVASATPVTSATSTKTKPRPRKAPSPAGERVQLAQFSPDRRVFRSDGSARAAVLDAASPVGNASRQPSAGPGRAQSGAARSRSRPGDATG